MLAKIVKAKFQSMPRNKWLLSFVALVGISLIVLLFASSNLHSRVKTKAQILIPQAEKVSDPISSRTIYDQEFVSRGTFNQIQLFFTPFARSNEGTTKVELIDGNTNLSIGSWSFENAKNITDEPILLDLDGNDLNKGIYRLKISSDNSNPDTSIGIFLQKGDIYEGELRVGDNIQESDISIGLYQKTYIGYFLLIGILAFSLICLWGAFVLLFIRKTDLWKVSIFLLMSFGMTYLFIFPSGTVNDTWRHYATVYEYSNELMGLPKGDSGTVRMRKSDWDTFVRYRGLANRNACIDQYFDEFDEFSWLCIDEALVESDIKSLSMANNTASSVVAYFPQIIGLTIGRLFSMGAIPCIFLSRLLQLICVALLIGLSVKIIPIGKEILLFLSLTPIFLQQVTAFSYDGMAFCFAFLFISLCTKLKLEKKIVYAEDYIVLLLSTIGVCACRGGMYAVLLTLLFMIPNSNLDLRKKYFIWFVGIITTLAFYGNSYLNITSSAGNENVLNLGSPFEHPVRIGMLFVSSLVENIDVYVGGMFGQQMGWNQSIIPFSLIFILILLTIVVSLSSDSAPTSFSAKDRVILFLPILFILGIALLSMYIGENHRATAWNIWGVQGRYFIPVLPLAFFQVQNRSIVLKKDIRKIIIYLFCNMEVLSTFSLLRIYLIR